MSAIPPQQCTCRETAANAPTPPADDYAAALRYFLRVTRERLPEPEKPLHTDAEELRLRKLLAVIPHNRPLIAKEIAKLVGRKNTPRLRTELGILKRRGLIRRADHRWGYLRIVPAPFFDRSDTQ